MSELIQAEVEWAAKQIQYYANLCVGRALSGIQTDMTSKDVVMLIISHIEKLTVLSGDEVPPLKTVAKNGVGTLRTDKPSTANR